MTIRTQQDNSWELFLASLRQLSPEYLKERMKATLMVTLPLTATESPLSIVSRHQNVVQYAQSLRKALIDLDSACGLDPAQFHHEQQPSKKGY